VAGRAGPAVLGRGVGRLGAVFGEATAVVLGSFGVAERLVNAVECGRADAQQAARRGQYWGQCIGWPHRTGPSTAAQPHPCARPWAPPSPYPVPPTQRRLNVHALSSVLPLAAALPCSQLCRKAAEPSTAAYGYQEGAYKQGQEQGNTPVNAAVV